VSVDLDLLRRLAFELEAMERSPPEPLILGISDLSARLNAPQPMVEDALQLLASLSLIDGPGAFSNAWLFRRLTARGRVFVDEVRRDGRWDEIKAIYGPAGDP
jgi:hypothetical protein